MSKKFEEQDDNEKHDEIAGAQDGFTVVLDQCQFAFEQIDELVLMRMPVPLARPGARFQRDVADSEVGEARRWREPPVPSARDFLVERRRIAGAVHLLDGVEIDLRHGQCPFRHG